MSYDPNDQRETHKGFLGTGIAFPFQMSAGQRLRLVSGEEDIRQSIQIILGTAPGERLMRPEFGCRAHELVFAPYNTALQALLIYYVEEALDRWEPRIEVKKVEIEGNGTEKGQGAASRMAIGQVVVRICYMVKATHDERSIVYPFHIESEAA